MTVLELLVDSLPDKYIEAVINNVKDKIAGTGLCEFILPRSKIVIEFVFY